MHRTAAASIALCLCASAMAAETPLPVIELFTSEGCSSCPPADAALTAMIRDGKAICLAFHVDYWDKLGWRDPWSSREASERQQAYVRTFGGGAYTPEAVVNGRRGVNGADTAALARAMTDLARPAHAMTLTATWTADHVDAEARITGAPASAVMLFALVESGLSSRITAGENKGATLAHDHVVRACASARVAGGIAAARLPMPAQIVLANAQLIAYVQSEPAHAIIAAAVLDPPKP